MTAHVTDRPPAFAVERAPLSGAPGVLVRGDLDIDTTPELTATLDAAIRDSRGAFVIDLRDVSLLASSGVTALLRARALLGRDDRTLVLVCPPGPALRTLELVGIVDVLAPYGSRTQAAAALQGRERDT